MLKIKNPIHLDHHQHLQNIYTYHVASAMSTVSRAVLGTHLCVTIGPKESQWAGTLPVHALDLIETTATSTFTLNCFVGGIKTTIQVCCQKKNHPNISALLFFKSGITSLAQNSTQVCCLNLCTILWIPFPTPPWIKGKGNLQQTHFIFLLQILPP